MKCFVYKSLRNLLRGAHYGYLNKLFLSFITVYSRCRTADCRRLRPTSRATQRDLASLTSIVHYCTSGRQSVVVWKAIPTSSDFVISVRKIVLLINLMLIWKLLHVFSKLIYSASFYDIQKND